MMHRVLAITCLSVCLASIAGCSTLGFPTSPVAHTVTDATKEVLNASPRNAPLPRELDKEVIHTHYLEPGDEILIESNDFDTQLRIPADQQVAADGSVDLAKYGRVKIASLTLEEAEDRIQRAIAAVADEPVSINVRLIQSVQRYYVIGEVNSPGAYPLTGHETVLDGIVAGGGLSQRASACDMMLARPTTPCSCRVTLPVCYRAITQLGDTTTNYQLRPGDRIFVGRQTISEELLQFCLLGKGCDRCCQEHRACRDPFIAERLNPCFASPAIQTIGHPAEKQLIESTNDSTVNEPSNSEPVQEDLITPDFWQRGDDSIESQPNLDGELEFGDFRRQE